MNPVFQREMRTQARSPQPWRLRLLATSLTLGGLALLLWFNPAMFVGQGTEAFLAVNYGAALILGIIGPLLTHDLLSRERREGTLGLLCSTPLTSREMVLGKVSSAFLQAVAVWLVMTPILMLPLLQGGVQFADVVLMIALQGGITLSGLASGLAASAWNRSAGWALLSGYALLLLVMIAILIPAGVVVAVAGGTTPGAIEYTLAAVGLFGCLLVSVGFYFLAAQESEHAWNRIQFLGETADEVMTTLGVVAPDPPPPLPQSLQTQIRAVALPTDAEVERPAPPEPDVDSVGVKVEAQPLGMRLLRRHRLRMRSTDPWRWLLERRRDPLWLVPFLLVGSYVWWLGFGVRREPPAWPEWVLPGLMVLRLPRLLREERRSGMLEVLATCPTYHELPGAVCRMIWWEFGPLLALHALFALGTSWVMGASKPMGGLVTASLALVFGPWVGLWVARWVRNYFIGVLACLVGTLILGWIVVWLLGVLVHRWALGDWRILVWPIEGAVGSSLMLLVPPFVQIAVGIAAVRAVRRWVSGGGTGQRGV
jgi:ABC-type transport system involved in multi-copper enzyme maturation permease subunit